MKADDDSMNQVELAIFGQVQEIFNREGISEEVLRPITVTSNGTFASLTVTHSVDVDPRPFEQRISGLLKPLSVTKIVYRPIVRPVAEDQVNSPIANNQGSFLDPFADFSFSASRR